MSNRSVKIGELEHIVKFPLSVKFRDEVEGITGKSLMASFTSGMLKDQAAIILIGLRHGGNKKLSMGALLEMLQEHESLELESGDVVRQVFGIAFNDKVLGPGANYAELRRLFKIGEDDEAGKAHAPTSTGTEE